MAATPGRTATAVSAEAPRADRGERPLEAEGGELQAKRRWIGQRQRPAELVPIPEYLLSTSRMLRKASEGFGKFGAFSKNPEIFG